MLQLLFHQFADALGFLVLPSLLLVAARGDEWRSYGHQEHDCDAQDSFHGATSANLNHSSPQASPRACGSVSLHNCAESAHLWFTSAKSEWNGPWHSVRRLRPHCNSLDHEPPSACRFCRCSRLKGRMPPRRLLYLSFRSTPGTRLAPRRLGPQRP